MTKGNIVSEIKARIVEINSEIEVLELQIEESRSSNIGDDEVLVHDLEDKLSILIDELDSLEISLSQMSLSSSESEYLVELNGRKLKLKIVPPNISNPSQGLISIETPLGAELSKRKKGDKFVISTPSGDLEYKVIDIT